MSNRKRDPLERAVARDSITRILELSVVTIIFGLILLSLSEYKLKNFWNPLAQSEVFRQAVNKAMSSAQLTQSAKSKEEWDTVVSLWQEAIDLMKNVPTSSEKYEVAQKKVAEYERNVQYAQSQSLAKSSVSEAPSNLWSLGSSWEELIRTQGTPTEIVRDDFSCQEVVHYGRSTVTLKDSMVTTYDNSDQNLRVSLGTTAANHSEAVKGVWDIGSQKKNIFRVQGTPTQVTWDYFLDHEVLHYGSSTVNLKDGVVAKYNNLGNNLKVSVDPQITVQSKNSNDFWNLGSQREAVLKIQGTPTQIVQEDSSCEEVLYYGNSTVELKYRVVNSYSNIDNNLRVK